MACARALRAIDRYRSGLLQGAFIGIDAGLYCISSQEPETPMKRNFLAAFLLAANLRLRVPITLRLLPPIGQHRAALLPMTGQTH